MYGTSAVASAAGPLRHPELGGGGSSLATYTYAIINHLTGVSMPRSSGTRTRAFNRTNGTTVGALLLSATNPENVYDAISGESVAYQYDSLNRLISAAGSGWTQTQAYDGFGNLTGRTGTGTAQSTTISTPVNATTNQLSGYTYDTNGNLISTGYTYDVENRISFANAGGVQYFYDAQNKRVWQATCLPGSCTPGGTWILNSATVNLFGADRKQLASYGPIPAWNNMTTNQVAITFGPVAVRSYFGGKLVGQQLGTNIYEPVIQDRLGSVGKYYPYGEERNSPQLPNDQVKFATYTRDSATGNDYADQRYYTSTLGRFMTPDRVRGRATNPQSWDRYAYGSSDPVGLNDPTGLFPPPMYETPDPFSDPSGDYGGGGGYCDPSDASCNDPCVGADGFTPSPSPFCQIEGASPPEPVAPPVSSVQRDTDLNTKGLTPQQVAQDMTWVAQGLSYLQKWAPAGSNTACNADLKALGLSPQAIQNIASTVVPFLPTSLFQFGASWDFAVVDGGYPDAILYWNPQNFWQTTFSQILGTLLHEFAHFGPGVSDSVAAADVGVVFDPFNTWYISDKLMRDCFSGVQNP